MNNKQEYAVLEKDTKNLSRKYCGDCKGYVLTITAYGKKIFCKVCNGLIEEK